MLTGDVVNEFCSEAEESSIFLSLDCSVRCSCCHRDLRCECANVLGWVDGVGDDCNWYVLYFNFLIRCI